MVRNVFPPLSKEEILNRVEEAWDLSGDFPLPKVPIKCPVCGSGEIQARNWIFHLARDPSISRVPYRCDVSFKCTRCSAVWVHGIAIPEKIYRKHVKTGEKQRGYYWREVKKILEQTKD